jgi:hypothetical protein
MSDPSPSPSPHAIEGAAEGGAKEEEAEAAGGSSSLRALLVVGAAQWRLGESEQPYDRVPSSDGDSSLMFLLTPLPSSSQRPDLPTELDEESAVSPISTGVAERTVPPLSAVELPSQRSNRYATRASAATRPTGAEGSGRRGAHMQW